MRMTYLIDFDFSKKNNFKGLELKKKKEKPRMFLIRFKHSVYNPRVNILYTP